jgi:hypothetical protein
VTTTQANRIHRGTRPYARPLPIGDCPRCGRTETRIVGRKLCGACYEALRRRGELGSWPPRTRRTWAETVAEYEWLRASGETHEQIAARLGLRDARDLAYRLRKQGVAVAP